MTGSEEVRQTNSVPTFLKCWADIARRYLKFGSLLWIEMRDLVN